MHPSLSSARSRFIDAATLALPLSLLLAAPVAALTLDADAYIRGGIQANSANGLLDHLTAADNVGASGDFKTYLRFDLSAVTETIADAELKLTLDSGFLDTPDPVIYNVWGMGDALGDNWDEATITYNNAVGNNPADYTDMTGSTLLGSFSYIPLATDAGDMQVFSSAAFDLFLNTGVGADDLATLIILGTSCCHDQWASRENGTYDSPGVTYTPGGPPVPTVPLPAAGWMLLAGLAGLGAAGRRRTCQAG